MAICGLPIPVTQAKLPLFDDVFVDAGAEQSIEQSNNHNEKIGIMQLSKNSLVIFALRKDWFLLRMRQKIV